MSTTDFTTELRHEVTDAGRRWLRKLVEGNEQALRRLDTAQSSDEPGLEGEADLVATTEAYNSLEYEQSGADVPLPPPETARVTADALGYHIAHDVFERWMCVPQHKRPRNDVALMFAVAALGAEDMPYDAGE